ncbi:hypothetical protein FXO38_00023 [Capsicum annuum]|uniref:Uncharacterized protein n=1 Tax=Capsicum annuum TaxID=4072 RepID=A0A2G2XYS3_CAPAN|nr:hypothetical protein FXO38_00023 [Capsicum annuum]KAF3686051.1 hypothetical protein FXO37_00013 [Capsicum annuum]PHT62645.1 hypothetical protein T459_33540 [Capsicum annuum]
MRRLTVFAWQEFNNGMVLVLLITFCKSSLDGPTKDALVTLSKPTMDFPSLIIQATIVKNDLLRRLGMILMIVIYSFMGLEMMNNYLERNVKLNMQCKELNGENLDDEKKIQVIMQ